MSNIIVATEEQIQSVVFKAISKFFSGKEQQQQTVKLPDTISLSGALQVLDEHGFPTSKGKLYKMTSLGTVPFRKYGNKLVFSRKALIEWANQQLEQ